MEFPAHINKKGLVQSVFNHCSNVANIAKNKCDSIGLGCSAYIVGIIHDAGKSTVEFAEYLKMATSGDSVKRGSIIHSFAGVSYLISNYHSNGQINDNAIYDLTSEILSITVGSHHGLFDCFDRNGKCGFTYRVNKQPEYDNRAVNNFFEEFGDIEKFDLLFKRSYDEIESLIPKIISCSNQKEDECNFVLSLITRFLLSALIDADRRDTSTFMNPERSVECKQMKKSDWDSHIEKYDSYMKNFSICSPVGLARKELSDECYHSALLLPGIYRLNLPTGGGKTLSGLRFALKHAATYGKKRIFFISPLLSILEQNAEQIRRAVGDDSIILEHHSDVINDALDENEISRYDDICDTWDSPIVITTLVQFLNTLFSGKTSSIRRFHSLADSIIVIDEVQSVPLKMLSLFNTTLNFLSELCNTTVLLCSATQPELDSIAIPHSLKINGDIISRNILKKYYQVFKRNVVSYKGQKRLKDLNVMIDKLFEEKRNVLVICNKKDQAYEVFYSFEQEGIEKYHLSAGMCMAHRKSVLGEIKEKLNKKEKVLCVSTQVIEAGVDISFEAVIRLSAGLDSIVQAAGRCNRNGESGTESPVWVVDCEDEKLTYLKDIYDAKETTRSLLYAFDNEPDKFDSDLTSDKAISFYYQKMYNEKPEGYFDYIKPGYPSIYSLLSLNTSYSYGEDAKKYQMHQAIKTAGDIFEVFEANEKSVIVPWEAGGEIIAEIYNNERFITKEIIDQAKPYTVSVYSFMFDKLVECGAIIPLADGKIYILDHNYYDNNTGIKINVKGECLWNTLIL